MHHIIHSSLIFNRARVLAIENASHSSLIYNRARVRVISVSVSLSEMLTMSLSHAIISIAIYICTYKYGCALNNIYLSSELSLVVLIRDRIDICVCDWAIIEREREREGGMSHSLVTLCTYNNNNYYYYYHYYHHHNHLFL